jgi:hypothetical protein
MRIIKWPELRVFDTTAEFDTYKVSMDKALLPEFCFVYVKQTTVMYVWDGAAFQMVT